jgi:Porin PorA
MRRLVWSVLTGLGVFFIIVAIMARFFIPGQAVKFPLNEFDKTTTQAANASYFSPKFVTEESGVTLRATNTQKGDVAAAKSTGKSSSVAVWDSFTAIEDITHHQPVSIPAKADVLAFDRKSGALVPWKGNLVGGKPVNVSGQGPLFPLNTKKHSYQVFDTTLTKPVTYHYTGTSTTGGVGTYVFAATVPSTQIGTEQLPGSLVGMTAAQVTLPEFYSAKYVYYVDPKTGVPLAVDENVQEVLKDSAGTTRLVLLSADFKTTQATVASGVKTDNNARNEINLLTLIIPIVAGLLGIILLIVGVVLSRARPDDEEYEDDERTVGVPA